MPNLRGYDDIRQRNHPSGQSTSVYSTDEDSDHSHGQERLASVVGSSSFRASLAFTS